MPLVAKDQHGQRVDATEYFSDAEWDRLRQQVKSGKLMLHMPCCGAIAWPRTHADGLHHFYHRHMDEGDKGKCHAASESPQHRALKKQVAALFRALGWDVQIEAVGDGWRADVLLEKEGRKVAIEIQLSSQTSLTTKIRHKKYHRDGINCLWLMTKIPPDLESSASMPVFQILQEDEGWMVIISSKINQTKTGLEDFAKMLDQKQVRHRLLKPQQIQADVYRWRSQCYSCAHHIPTIFAKGYLECDCGTQLRVVDQTSPYLGAGLAKAIKAGQIRTDVPFALGYNRRLERREYRPLCPRCNAPQGNSYLAEEYHSPLIPKKQIGSFRMPTAGLDFPGWWEDQPEHHWCIPGAQPKAIDHPDLSTSKESIQKDFQNQEAHHQLVLDGLG